MRKFLYRILLLQLLALATALFTLCFAQSWWVADLFNHFMLQYTLLALVTFVGLLCLRVRRSIMIIAGFALFIVGVQIATLLIPRHITRGAAYDDVTVLQFNMNLTNANVDIDTLIGQTLPDIIVLQEATPAVTDRLAELNDSFPNHLISPRKDGFGSAIYSKIPITDKARHRFECSGNEYSDIDLRTLHGVVLGLTELHTMAPMSAGMTVKRNEEIREITVHVNQQEAQAKLLVGDMNVTVYSPLALATHAQHAALQRHAGQGNRRFLAECLACYLAHSHR